MIVQTVLCLLRQSNTTRKETFEKATSQTQPCSTLTIITLKSDANLFIQHGMRYESHAALMYDERHCAHVSCYW